MGPSFNENFAEKSICGSCEQCTRPTKKSNVGTKINSVQSKRRLRFLYLIIHLKKIKN